jgi:hypothetical protein
MIWQLPELSIRRISFKNSIWRDGDSADSGSSKMKMPCFRQLVGRNSAAYSASFACQHAAQYASLLRPTFRAS